MLKTLALRTSSGPPMFATLSEVAVAGRLCLMRKSRHALREPGATAFRAAIGALAWCTG